MPRLLLPLLLATAVSAGEVPLGDKAFYPSPERPIGYRGDGNGWFPGATPPAEWWDGTPVEKEQDTGEKDKKGQPKLVKFWDFADTTPKNIAWRTGMPGWANTQPLVIGDRIITYAEPDQVVCCDANTGRILWTTVVNPWVAAGVDPAKAETARRLYGVRDALELVVQLQWHFGTCGRYLTTEQLNPVLRAFLDQDAPLVAKTLAALDPQGGYEPLLKEFTDRIAAAIATPVDQKGCWGYGKNFKLIGQIGKRIEAITGRKLPLGVPWGNMVGWCMSVPVSDGAFIYAALGQGQTACLDLNGKVVWQVFFEQKDVSTHHVLSPLLADGVLVDMHGSGTLRGLDATTGKTLWEAPTARPAKSEKSGYYVASHRVVRLNGTAYIVTSQCAIIRAKDGRTVGEFDYGPAYGGGCPIAGEGDLILKCANGDGWGQPFRAFRLTAESPDKVVAEKLWETKDGGGYESRIVTPQAAWICNRDATAVDPATGAMLNKAPIGGCFRLQAGNLLISSPKGSDHWSSRRADGKGLIPFTTADVTDPKAPKVVSNCNLIGGPEIARNPLLEAVIPATWAQPQFMNAKGGRPAHTIHVDTCLMPSGNRLFLRTTTHLYALGDPAAPYDWVPASRPATITAGLKPGS